MKYFAVFLAMKDEEKSKEHRAAHLAFIEQMKQENKLAIYGRFVDGAGGLLIYQGETEEEVANWAKEDPYVSTGARNFEIHEWAMTVVE